MTLLTDKYIKSLQPRNHDYIITETTGKRGYGRLAIKVRTSGNKHFYFNYYRDKKRRSLPMGLYGKGDGFISLPEARNIANQYGAQINKGIDPREIIEQQELERQSHLRTLRQQAAAEAAKGSIKQLVDFYLEELEKTASTRHYQQTNRTLHYDFMPMFDIHLKANEITPHDIAQVLAPITKRGAMVQANRCRTYIMSMFKFGIQFDLSSMAIQKGVKFNIPFNPVRDTPKPLAKEPPRERVLTEDEIYYLWRVLDDSQIPPERKVAIKLLFVTGQRVLEVIQAPWEEFNLQERTWTIPASRTKNKRIHMVPLGQLAMDLIKEAQTYTGQYAFMCPNKNDPTNPIKEDGFHQMLKRVIAGHDVIEPFSPRDSCGTCKTLMGKIGLSKDIRDRLQNHALQDVSSKHYDRYTYLKEKHAAMNKWNDYLTKIINGQHNEVDNVVNFPS